MSRVDATTANPLHYKAELENDRLGQWDLFHRKTGAPLEPVVVIEWVDLYAPVKPRMRKLADGRKVPEKLNKREVKFVGIRKTWIANITCQEQISRLHGPKPQGWIGKKIRLYFDPDVMIGRQKVGGIRVRGVDAGAEPTDEPMDNEVDARVRAIQKEALDQLGDGST